MIEPKSAERTTSKMEYGNEILAPLAVVVLGGLASSTLLNLVVVPAAATLVLKDPRPDPAGRPS